jgi:hypothetical protein
MSLGDAQKEHEGSWREYRLLILDKLETLAQNQEAHKQEMTNNTGKIYKAISDIKTDLATQKTKVGIIGSVGGAITGLITGLIAWLKTH